MDTQRGADATLEALLGDIRRITQNSNAVLRNLLITQRYHDLSQSLSSVVGTSNANWSNFATWASKTAGQSIRGEEVPDEVAEVLRRDAEFELRLAAFTRPIPLFNQFRLDLDVFDWARAVMREVSLQIAEGNLKVFAELAPLFAHFGTSFADPAARTDAALAAFLERLAPGSVEAGGQDLLKLAFTCYFKAANSADHKARAEFVLRANLLVGLHEQTRLQDNIKGGLDAPVSARVLRELGASSRGLLAPVVRWLVMRKVHHFHHDVRETWERVATRFFMRLALPDGRSISLGEDVPVGARAFPPNLDPLLDPEVLELVTRFDSNLVSLKGSAAKNWTDLKNRMAFITDLFRSQQEEWTLFQQPFSDAQRRQIELGQVPAGPL